MEAKRHGDYLVLWSVIDSDGEEEKVVAYFKDPNKAAGYALKNRFFGAQMSLCKPEWNIRTMD